MNTQDIQSLIDRYLAGETSNDEERRLALALYEAAEATDEPLPDDWQAVLLMLGELTLGEALYDDILARRNRSLSAESLSMQNVSAGSTSSKNRRLRVWRWAAAIALVFATSLGIAFYQSKTSQRTVASASTNNGTSEYHQWDTLVSPVRQPDANSRVNEHDQSHESTRTVASGNANRRKRKAVQPMSKPSSAELPAPPQEEGAEESLLAAAEAELQKGDVQYQALSPDDDPYAAIEAAMRDIRSRGERVEAMVAEITRPY